MLLFCFLACATVWAQNAEFNKTAFYKVMENSSVESIDQEIKKVESTADNYKDAYTGALLMKKSGLIAGAAKKLNVFKQGHKKLEAAIEKDPLNPEFRFLRLMIQENAPKIVKYHSDIEKDVSIIQESYKKMSPELQTAVMDYRKQSKSLKNIIL